jgi:hypothetical protein
MVAQAATTPDPTTAGATPVHLPTCSPVPTNAECLLPNALPPLTDRDSHLLAAFLIYRFDLATLADREKLHPTQLLAFTQSPAVAAHLQAYRQFADEAFHLRSLESRTNAINLLEDLARKSTDPIEKRRCASAIIRGLSIPITRTFKPSTFLHPPHRPNQSHPRSTEPTTESSAAREPGRPRPGSDHPVRPTPDENAPTHPLRQEPTSNATTRASQEPPEFHETPNPQASVSFRTERRKPSALPSQKPHPSPEPLKHSDHTTPSESPHPPRPTSPSLTCVSCNCETTTAHCPPKPLQANPDSRTPEDRKTPGTDTNTTSRPDSNSAPSRQFSPLPNNSGPSADDSRPSLTHTTPDTS